MKEEKKKGNYRRALERISRQGLLLLAAMIVVSAFLHFTSFRQLANFKQIKPLPRQSLNEPARVVLKYPPLPSAKKAPEELVPQVTDPIEASVIEVPQPETEAPTNPRFLGQTKHTAKVETRVKKNLDNLDKDPGIQGNASQPTPTRQMDVSKQEEVPRQTLEENAEKTPQDQQQERRVDSKTDGNGSIPNQKKDSSRKLGIGSLEYDMKPASAPRNSYEKLLAYSSPNLSGQMNAGYQDFIEDDIQYGEAVDINTQEYRFVGYTTAMRKALSLVWTYPSEAARRGQEGQVDVVFGIDRTGETSKIKVVRTSGYPLLDHAIIEALKIASFPPPPDGFIDPEKKIKLLKGRFYYSLTH